MKTLIVAVCLFAGVWTIGSAVPLDFKMPMATDQEIDTEMVIKIMFDETWRNQTETRVNEILGTFFVLQIQLDKLTKSKSKQDKEVLMRELKLTEAYYKIQHDAMLQMTKLQGLDMELSILTQILHEGYDLLFDEYKEIQKKVDQIKI